MVYMTSPNSNSVYSSTTGTTSTDVFITVLAPINPSASDINYPVQKRWINTVTYTEFMLIGFTSFNGLIQANWIPLGSVGGVSLKTVKGNTGPVVAGDSSDNVLIIGDGTTCTVAGNAGTHSLTISALTSPTQTASFEASATIDQNNVTGDKTVYVVQFPNVIYDSASNFNSGTGYFLAPYTGTYSFTCGIGYSPGNGLPGSTATYIQGAFYKNGALYYLGFALPSSETCVGYQGFNNTNPCNYQSFSGIFRLQAGDTIACVIIGDGLASKPVSITPSSTATCFFSGALI